MCGFVGFLTNTVPSADAGKQMLVSMCDAIKHRGPDAEGVWIDAENGIGLGHRRLAIVDLSSAGAQPMVSTSGRYVIAFNGEIYNHLSLRRDLEQAEGLSLPGWRGHSDTETLLACFDLWGVDATLKRTIGMFAFAVWDHAERALMLVRDRMGEKPLYYGWQGHGNQAVFLFGSELSALRKHPAFAAEIDRDALALYMRHNCIGGEYSIYAGISKLLPGHYLTVSVKSREPIVKAWWSTINVVAHGALNPFNGTPEHAVDTLDTLLGNAIGQQMVADVPLGAFLSGGVDSSTIAALMQAQSSKPIRTFSIGFHEAGFNEAAHAKAVARHLGTDHTELYVTSHDALRVIPNLPSIYSEPFADSSQIPTFLVSQLARQHVAVSLSGDGGDELFGGYTRYEMTAKFWNKLAHIPSSWRQLVANIITVAPPNVWDKLGGLLSLTRFGEKLYKGAGVLGSPTIDDLYSRLVSDWSNPNNVVLGAREPALLSEATKTLAGLGGVERMMAFDTLSYLPDDILVKVDRAAMGVSLETRVPFLDHRVVEFACSLPIDYKLHNGITKWPIRQLLYRHVPIELIERPKMGFGVPIGQWLRGPLRDWAESLLSESRLRSQGYFNPIPIRQKWAEHLSGKQNWQHHLWSVLMFQAWLEAQHR